MRLGTGPMRSRAAHARTGEEDHFASRAKLMQRTLFRLQGRLGAWLFSSLLGTLAGYGYR